MSQKLIKTMKEKVEAYWTEMKAHSPFQQALAKGSISADWVHNFLVNVHYLVQHTPAHLHLATLHANRLGETALRDFFIIKFEEEQGHDQWAEDDMAKIKSRIKQNLSKTNIDPNMKKMVQSIENLIERDPYLYLPYIFFAEYLCVIAGPEMSANLEEKCGYPPKSLSIVENHAELDVEHVDEWEEVIQDLVDPERYSSAFLQTLDECMQLHKAYFWNCGAAGKTNAAA